MLLVTQQLQLITPVKVQVLIQLLHTTLVRQHQLRTLQVKQLAQHIVHLIALQLRTIRHGTLLEVPQPRITPQLRTIRHIVQVIRLLLHGILVKLRQQRGQHIMLQLGVHQEVHLVQL